MKALGDSAQKKAVFFRAGFVKRLMLTICSSAFLLGICSCAHLLRSGASDYEAIETEAVEALFLSFMHNGFPTYHRDQGSNYVVEVVFLAKGSPGFDGNIAPLPNQFGSAPVAWLSRLSNHGVTIKDVKDAVYSKDLKFVIDRDNGKPGEIFQVEKITRISPEEVHIDAQRYSGFMNAAGAHYILRRKYGKWYVANIEDSWIQ